MAVAATVAAAEGATADDVAVAVAAVAAAVPAASSSENVQSLVRPTGQYARLRLRDAVPPFAQVPRLRLIIRIAKMNHILGGPSHPSAPSFAFRIS